ncbi:DUF3135 domain-containing protein [Uliginosibacterium sp. H1]|uniref:DUF3135 domain-containing protein n=1 Tax=Uliginosibacterium sp. H1 TaxID=3114757 RepID=UPI002E186C92|nr:DUF3135 domain-containing protein [Uliginosibacterium sp. H1]
MTHPSHENFDFDYWSALARRDPAAFFAERTQMIDAFIASVPAQHRDGLRNLQHLIDATRLEAGTPMQAVRKMMGMLGDQLGALQGQLVELRKESDRLAAAAERLRS